MAWQRVRIQIPDSVKPADRSGVGNQIVARIRERAIDGVGVKKSGGSFINAKFPKYTKEYAKRKGVSRGSVDLVLSGKMLTALKLLSSKKGSVLVGFKKGATVNKKAEGNITGSYGGSPNKSKARNFLGLPKSDVNRIVRETV